VVSLIELRQTWAFRLGDLHLAAACTPESVTQTGLLTIVVYDLAMLGVLQAREPQILARLPEIDDVRVKAITWTFAPAPAPKAGGRGGRPVMGGRRRTRRLHLT
jgi:hypothetical protein